MRKTPYRLVTNDVLYQLSYSGGVRNSSGCRPPPPVEASTSNERLAWSITDAGPACEIARLLTQPDATPADGGLGLGLLFAHAIARCHRGELRASEITGGGVRLYCEARSLANAAD